MPDSYEGELFVNQLETNKGDITETLKDLDRYANSFKADGDYQQYNTLTAFGDRVREAYPNGGKLNIEDNFGYLYNVDLKVDPDDLLDWDAPLSEQSEAIRAALGRDDKWTTGASFYHLKSGAIDDQLTEKSGELYDFIQTHPKFNAEERNFSSGEVISAWLNSKGVPGIRYYDGLSRDAKEGTRNFVIFDDSLIEIKTRNGEALTPVQRQEAVTSMKETGSGKIKDGDVHTEIPNTPKANEKVIELPLSQIEHGEAGLPGGTLDAPGARETIQEYADRPTPFPPIEVMIPDEDSPLFMVSDGSRRLEAAKLRGDNLIQAIVPIDFNQ